MIRFDRGEVDAGALARPSFCFQDIARIYGPIVIERERQKPLTSAGENLASPYALSETTLLSDFGEGRRRSNIVPRGSFGGAIASFIQKSQISIVRLER